jgi:hypothetical protein
VNELASSMGEVERIRLAFEAAATYSETLMGWALLVIGGSVVALLQRSYLRPHNRGVRLAYLLFAAGWGFLASSVYHGTKVQEARLGLLFRSNPEVSRAIATINGDLLDQVNDLRWGLCIFGFWLIVYLVWWIAHKPPAHAVPEERRG